MRKKPRKHKQPLPPLPRPQGPVNIRRDEELLHAVRKDRDSNIHNRRTPNNLTVNWAALKSAMHLYGGGGVYGVHQQYKPKTYKRFSQK